MLGFIHYHLIINLLQSLISSIETLLFPKKLVFRVGKKSGGKQTSSFAIFGCVTACANCKCARLCGLAQTAITLCLHTFTSFPIDVFHCGALTFLNTKHLSINVLKSEL